jgi:hypothetical protein
MENDKIIRIVKRYREGDFNAPEVAMKAIEDAVVTSEQSFFPLLVQIDIPKYTRLLCSTPLDLPAGVPFKVLETNCDIEIRHGQYPKE